MIGYDIFLENAKKHQSINEIFSASNQEHIKKINNIVNLNLWFIYGENYEQLL